MVGDDTDRNVVLGVCAVGFARDFDNGVDDAADGVDLKHVVHTLHDAGQTFQTHTGVDVLLCQLGIGAVSHVVELGENVVPDLHKAVAVAAGAAVRVAAAVLFAAVEVDLGAGAAGAGTVLPEVVRFAQLDDAFLGDADDVTPERVGFIVLFVNRRPETVSRNLETLGQKLPGPRNCLILEIIAEGEVTQHLEEGTVTRGQTDAVKVGGTDAFLAGGDAVAGRLNLSGEEFLQGCHTRVDEQQRFVALRHQREGGQTKMPFAFKKGEIFLSKIIKGCPLHGNTPNLSGINPVLT